MISTLGQLSLLLALACSAGSMLTALSGGGLGGTRAVGIARGGMRASAALLGIAALVLTAALLGDNLQIAYVAEHSERSMPVVYKVAAFWSGQEGSLLLWALLLGAMSVIACRGRTPARGTLATLSGINVFFLATLCFGANPFRLGTDGTLLDGRGLHPLLQHWAMVLHPPILFTGYAASAVPFALMVGALVRSKERGFDGALAETLRPWVMSCWLALTAGIILGAWWAYVELGWGGYWAWDPVENASLLPWLTCTALFHSVQARQRAGRFKAWVCALCAATFLLCMVGTYLTRSGIVQSMHAFAAAGVGRYFLLFLLVTVGGTAALFIWRRRLLFEPATASPTSLRDTLVWLCNAMLVVAALATLIGTLAPAVSGLLRERPLGVGAAYYNRFVVPLALIAIALMTVGPLVPASGSKRGRVRSDLLKCLGVGLTAGAAAAWLGVREPMAVLCILLCGAGVTSIGLSLSHAAATTPGLAGKFAAIAGHHRRYAGQVGHLGVLLVVAGVAGSSLFETTRNLTLSPGQTAAVGSYSLRLEQVHQLQRANYSAVEAVLTLTSADGGSATIAPQRRFYDKAEQSGAEVALRTGLFRDIYFVLVGWEAGGSTVALQARVIPMVSWIWAGAAIMLLGGAFCLIPSRALVRFKVPAAASAGKSSPTQAGPLSVAGALTATSGAHP